MRKYLGESFKEFHHHLFAHVTFHDQSALLRNQTMIGLYNHFSKYVSLVSESKTFFFTEGQGPLRVFQKCFQNLEERFLINWCQAHLIAFDVVV